jgi:lipopolysaccharide transport system permease protein
LGDHPASYDNARVYDFLRTLRRHAKQIPGDYSLFVFAALLPWMFFAGSIANAGGSLISSSNLVSKVYFPRLIVPISSVGVNLVDFMVGFLVMLAMMVWKGVVPHWQIVLTPLFLFGVLGTALGVGTLLAALVVSYRDFRYVLGFLVQLWMFASPVAYPLSVVPEKWQLLYALNPMVGMITGFRTSLLGGAYPWPVLGVSFSVTITMLAVGVLYFRRVERRFADII